MFGRSTPHSASTQINPSTDIRQSRFAPKSAKTASYSPSSTHNPPDTVGNLFFDGLSPVTRVKFAGRELDFILAQLPQFEVV